MLLNVTARRAKGAARRQLVGAHLTVQEARALRRVARAAGETVSDYIRKAINLRAEGTR